VNEQKTYLEEGGGGAIYNGIKVSPQGDQVVNDKKTITSSFSYRKKMFYVKENYVKPLSLKLTVKFSKLLIRFIKKMC
jgi:hypothetical protein